MPRPIHLAVALLLGCGSTPAEPAEPVASASETSAAHAWRVYDGELLILELEDTPGPLLSTALPPPGVAPPSHPFLSGSARSAAHEGRLRELLDASRDVPSYLDALRDAGFRVEPQP